MLDKLIRYILKESGIEEAVNEIALSFIYTFNKRPEEVDIRKISEMFGVEGNSVEEILTSLLSRSRKNDNRGVDERGNLQKGEGL